MGKIPIVEFMGKEGLGAWHQSAEADCTCGSSLSSTPGAGREPTRSEKALAYLFFVSPSIWCISSGYPRVTQVARSRQALASF